jgi:hypothetical protein
MEDGNPICVDIREEWDWVRVGVEEILAEQPQLTYRAEDVYAACVNNNALLWVTEQSDGFVVSTQETDSHTGDRTFLVWVAWTKVRGQNCVVKHYNFFADIARENGFKYSKKVTRIIKNTLLGKNTKNKWRGAYKII